MVGVNKETGLQRGARVHNSLAFRTDHELALRLAQLARDAGRQCSDWVVWQVPCTSLSVATFELHWDLCSSPFLPGHK